MEASEPRTIAILAEKPSVAQDIARVLGADKRGKGYLQGNGYVVTWAIGHLVSLAQCRAVLNLWTTSLCGTQLVDLPPKMLH
jgi:DNA topoisomerase-3